jgi:hypothetical protein
MNYGIKFCTTALVFVFFIASLSAQTAPNAKRPELTPAYLAVQKDWQAFTGNVPAKSTNAAQEDSLAKTYNNLIDRLEATTEQRAPVETKVKILPYVPNVPKERKFAEVQK